MRLFRDPVSIFLIDRNIKIEKMREINGENINNFFKNIELELFKYVLFAIGISN